MTTLNLGLNENAFPTHILYISLWAEFMSEMEVKARHREEAVIEKN